MAIDYYILKVYLLSDLTITLPPPLQNEKWEQGDIRFANPQQNAGEYGKCA